MAIRFTVENPWGGDPQEKFEFIFLNGDLSSEGEVIQAPPISTPMEAEALLAAWYPRATEIIQAPLHGVSGEDR